MTVGPVERLKNSNFILENGRTKSRRKKKKNQNNQINQMLCKSFILPWNLGNKSIAYSGKRFTRVLPNPCSKSIR